MFRIIDEMDIYNVKLTCYMIEIYKGELRDLLLPKNTKDRPKLDIKYAKGERFVEIKNATIKTLDNMEECNEVFDQGITGRKTRKTSMNDDSSRSHLIFSIMITSFNRITGKKQFGKLSFIDLAGSER